MLAAVTQCLPRAKNMLFEICIKIGWKLHSEVSKNKILWFQKDMFVKLHQNRLETVNVRYCDTKDNTFLEQKKSFSPQKNALNMQIKKTYLITAAEHVSWLSCVKFWSQFKYTYGFNSEKSHFWGCGVLFLFK